MKLILLTNTGKCGTLFIQRLFDGHPFVITFPFAFNFYCAWNTHLKSEDDLNSFLKKLLEETSLKEILNFIDREKYIKRVRDYLPNDFEIAKDRKELLEALHLAYNFLVSKNRKATHILLNTINVNFLDSVKLAYPDHKHLFLIRDPKNSYAAYLSSDHSNNPVYKFQFLRNSIHNAVYAQIFFKRFPEQVRFLRIEDLNEDLSVTMKNLCKWLEINFSDALMKETINSQNCNTTPNKLTERKMSAKIRNTRWVNSLSSTEVVLIEFLHKELISEHYTFISNKFYRNGLMAMLLLLLPNFRQDRSANHENQSKKRIFNPQQWIKIRLSWFSLLRAVARKDRLHF